MKAIYKYFATASLLLFFSNVIAQKNNITKIHTFMQKNADSSIILERYNQKILSSEYFILSKKGDTIATYTYKNVDIIKNDKKNKHIPSNISRELFFRDRVSFSRTPIDINFFFNPKHLPLDSLTLFWAQVSSLSPWQIKDDSIDGEGCPKLKEQNNKDGIIYDKQVYDGWKVIYYLVTQKEMKRLYFYAPETYENEICPGRAGRKSIIKIDKLFTYYFKE